MTQTTNSTGISSAIFLISGAVSYLETPQMHGNWQGMIAAAAVGGLTAAAGSLAYSAVSHVMQKMPVTPTRALSIAAMGVSATMGYDYFSDAIPKVAYRHNRPPQVEDFVRQVPKAMSPDTLVINNFAPPPTAKVENFCQNTLLVEPMYQAGSWNTDRSFTAETPIIA